MGELIAVADIGSNTAHLLIANVGEFGLKRVLNISEWLSLGMHVRQHGEIKSAKRKELVRVMKDFSVVIGEYRVEQSYVFATEALRQATNFKEVIGEIKKKTGIDVQLITPQQEAELSVTAMQVDTPGPDPTLMVEIGGGSVQVAFCRKGEVLREVDLKLGTGVMAVDSGLEYPVSVDALERLNDLIRDRCDVLKEFDPVARIVTCGGVSRGIWRALHPDGEREIRAEELEYLAWSTSRLSVPQIVDRFNVKIKRAETLLPGVLVMLEVLRQFGVGSFTTSRFGVREGAALKLMTGEGAWGEK